MKKLQYILPIIVMIMIGCGKKNNTNSDNKTPGDTTKTTVKIDSLAFEVDTFHCVEKETKCPNDDCGNVDLYYERIKTCLKPVHDSVNRYVDTLVLDMMDMMGGDEYKYDLKKRAFAFFETKRGFEAEDMESGGAWDYQMSLSITRSVNEIICVSSGSGGYTGGAHPNYESFTANFFVSTGKRVRMDDIFKDMDAVNKIGLIYFKKDNQLEADIDCMEQGWDFNDKNFTLNENFDISTESITWQFNSYEIGPYAAGAPSVTIPIKEIEKYMKVKFTDVVITQ